MAESRLLRSYEMITIRISDIISAIAILVSIKAHLEIQKFKKLQRKNQYYESKRD